jgi:hypothetical protein
MATKTTYSADKLEIVNLLKNTPDGLTNREITETLGRTVHAGTLTGLKKAGFIEVIGERELPVVTKSSVTVYRLVTAEPLKNAEGKEYNYTDSAKAVLAAAAAVEGDFTLADLDAGFTVAPGHVTHLVKKGNLMKLDEKRVVEKMGTVNRDVYGFAKDIPADQIA